MTHAGECQDRRRRRHDEDDDEPPFATGDQSRATLCRARREARADRPGGAYFRSVRTDAGLLDQRRPGLAGLGVRYLPHQSMHYSFQPELERLGSGAGFVRPETANHAPPEPIRGDGPGFDAGGRLQAKEETDSHLVRRCGVSPTRTRITAEVEVAP
jgi:hypothetical protein